MGIQAPWVGKTPEEYFGYDQENEKEIRDEYWLECEERGRDYE